MVQAQDNTDNRSLLIIDIKRDINYKCIIISPILIIIFYILVIINYKIEKVNEQLNNLEICLNYLSQFSTNWEPYFGDLNDFELEHNLTRVNDKLGITSYDIMPDIIKDNIGYRIEMIAGDFVEMILYDWSQNWETNNMVDINELQFKKLGKYLNESMSNLFINNGYQFDFKQNSIKINTKILISFANIAIAARDKGNTIDIQTSFDIYTYKISSSQ